jgi:hypothetical protein
MFAYSDWLPVSQEELKMTGIPQQPGAPAVVLYREEVDDDLKHSRMEYIRIKILTEDGRKYGDIEIPYDSKYQEIPAVQGRTIQPDGTVSNFEGKPFDRVLMRGNGVRWKVKAFAAPNVQVGSIVEYRFYRDLDDRHLYAPEWDLQGELFRLKQYFCFVPYYRGTVNSRGEAGWGIAWTYLLPKGNPGPIDNPVLKRIELTLNNTPAFIEEPDMPPARLYRYNVHFYYNAHHGTTGEFWKAEGKDWNRDVEGFMSKSGGLHEAIGATVAAGDTKEQKARKIYAFVQSLHNLTYSTQRSEAEMKALGLKEARGVQDVLRQKMGESEDLTRLYVAMARQAGIEAYVMRVASRHDSIFDEHYLDSRQLDHEIAIVKLESGEVQLDPGVRYCPYGVLYWRNSDTRGLRQTEKGAELASVLDSPLTDAWLRRDATFHLNADGHLEGSVQVTFKGQRALIQRLEFWKTDEQGRKKGLEEEVKRWLPENAEVTLTNQPQWESDGDLVAIFQVNTPAESNAGHLYLLPLDIFGAANRPARFPHAERQYPIVFDFGYRTTDHLHLTLPPDLQIESLPAPVEEKLSFGIYKLLLASKGNQIEVLRDVAIAGGAFPQSSYPELKLFYDKMKADDDLQAVLKGAANASGN